MQGADQFPQTGTWYFPVIGLSHLRRSTLTGSRRGVRASAACLAGERLLLPRRVYLCLGYENCRHLAFPDTSQNETKWTGAEARRGGERRNWFLLIHAARGTLHLIWPSILRNDLNTFCVKQCTGLVRLALCCWCMRWLARCMFCPGLGRSWLITHLMKQVILQTRIRVRLMNKPKVKGSVTLFSWHFICQ